jgi:trans-aconitate 2-methyltransferase
MSHEAPREWNAGEYHRLSQPQFEWGLKVLARLELRGDETVLDAGCGSGRVTEQLLERLPRGRVIALDQSENMLGAARALLEPRFGGRVRFVCADLQDFTLEAPVEIIFSTATFHWVLDHPRLFRALYRALEPGGRLHAQCGGGPNLAEVHERAHALVRDPEFAEHLAGHPQAWQFADAVTSATRLAEAGFDDVACSLESALVVLPDRDTYRSFLEHVVVRSWLAPLPSDALRQRFLDRLVEPGASDDPPWSLDYWRLNLNARRPAS